VVEAEAGEQALQLLPGLAVEPALLMTDVIMPGMSGPAVAEAVRRVHPRIRVLLMSGYTRDVLGRYGLPEGEVGFLQKPYTMSELATKVRELLDRPREGGAG
jgi:CheY-like chemotaxis protein